MELMLRDGVARVDDADADLINRFKPWYSMRTKQGGIYACTKIAGRTVYMHHVVLGHTPRGRGGGDVDHINGDGLDNRRTNLRLATRQQNNANTRSRAGSSQFKGVSWSRQHQKWQAHIMVDYKAYGLGLYDLETDAARAYDIAARKAFGDFALINLPDRIGEPAPERFSAKTIARELDAPAETAVVTHWRQGAGNGNAKLTEDDVRAIIRELQKIPRRSQISIAAEFGVRQTTISRIRRRESWAHLWDDA